MELIEKKMKLCFCCMEKHEVSYVRILEHNTFKGEDIEYPAVYEYCDRTDEYHAVDEMISENDIALKNAYRKKAGLLKTNEISDIRKKYNISQGDLSLLLGWGGKTITRYEGHQVQDAAHDAILRKIDSDKEMSL